MPGNDDTHLYGGSDAENRQTPAQDGFHGEGKAPDGAPDPAQTRDETLGNGHRVTIEEDSGVAAAEAAGNIGHERAQDAPGSS